MSLIWKFEEDFEMEVQFHVDMFHSIPENETVKKIATWKKPDTILNAKSSAIAKSLYINIATCAEVVIVYRKYRKVRVFVCSLSRKSCY
jgi:hypothetical protein